MDWDHMVERIDHMLPRDHAPVIRLLARDINAALSAFVRGQMTVCLLLGSFYSAALMLAGLQFGLLVGAIAGAITFIPYVGSLVGGALAIGLALFQFWGDWVSIGVVAAIFAAGQFIEGNILTPKLVGKSVGLHPVWLMFALSVFGSLFGFTGMLVAVPVAAALGVLTRFGLAQYQASLLYQGRRTRGEADRCPRSGRGRSASLGGPRRCGGRGCRPYRRRPCGRNSPVPSAQYADPNGPSCSGPIADHRDHPAARLGPDPARSAKPDAGRKPDPYRPAR